MCAFDVYLIVLVIYYVLERDMPLVTTESNNINNDAKR